MSKKHPKPTMTKEEFLKKRTEFVEILDRAHIICKTAEGMYRWHDKHMLSFIASEIQKAADGLMSLSKEIVGA